MVPFRRAIAATLVVMAAAACSSKDAPTAPAPVAPNPVIGLQAVAKTTTSVTVTFTSAAGDASYDIQRVEGASGGTFATIANVPAPAQAGTVSYVDNNLKVNTVYRYHVVTNKGSLQSAPTAAVAVTTLNFGNATADITTDITASRTFFADTVYNLKGFIHVANGATLTIQPGTKVTGDFNTLGSCLMVLRGAKIQAVGTADAPIVFTSSRPVGNRQPGDWGGLLLIGNAVSSRSGIVSIEGSGTDGSTVVGGKNYEVDYSGGTVQTDNSGTLSYVRVEFAGFAPSLNNEFNGFTFAAVGSGTRVSYTQTMAPLDDSYEFFGGALDGDHMVAFETADDMFDMSEGFQGRLQFLIGYNSVQLTPRTGAGFYATDLEGIENDGCAGSGCDLGYNQAPFTIPIVANYTLIGCGNVNCVGASGGYGMMIRRGSGGYYINGVLGRFPRAGISMRDLETYARAGSAPVPDMATTDLAMKSLYFADVAGTLFQTGTGQSTFDAAGNNLTLGSGSTQSLFNALPNLGEVPAGIAAFDFSPASGSPIATGGLNALTGKLQSRAGTFVTPTPYMGAIAPGGTKWWTGWTVYNRA